MKSIHGVRARLRLLRRGAAEERMDEEVRFHVEMETEKNLRAGMSSDEARRRALVAFGGVEKHKETLRDGRGLAWLGGLSLDLKLGFRMLVKYPGLTLVGGLAMAFAIWAGAVSFVLVGQFINPTLPLPGGDRVVQIGNWDVSANDQEPRALSDFLVWREGLRSVTDLGAYRSVAHNLIVGNDAGHPVGAAEVTASAFRIAPEPPLLGRVLVPADERPGAPPVVVLGYDVWRTRFAGDPGVVGRSVQLGSTYATVVGVMREGFAFPVSHEMWTPLRPDAAVYGPREGPGIEIFGRLAPGVTLEGAQAELTTIGRRAAAERPDTHEHLQPRVAPYTGSLQATSILDSALMLSIQLFAVMLLVLICSNVALLLFARAATRESELIVRSALGASRGRIVAQLFAEALVLGGVAAAVGLAAAQFSLRQWGVGFLERNLGQIPFWYDINLSPVTVLYALALTVLGAAIAGVMPALKITRGIGSRLKEGTAGGGLRFGGVWTAVIVAQVAVTVAFPAIVLVEVRELQRIRSYDAGFAAEEYLAVRLETDAAPGADADADSAAVAAHLARFGTVLETLRQRVAAEPRVAGVTFVDRLPRDNYYDSKIKLDDDDSAPAASAAQPPLRKATIASIDPSYFDVLEAPILSGRGFQSADLADGATVAIVDQSFVDQVLLGRNPIGRRVRISEDESAPWLQIVGLVRELGMNGAAEQGRGAGLYLPAMPGRDFPPYMVIHAQGDPMSLIPRVRAIAGAVDPTLRLSEIQRVDQVTSPLLWILGMWVRITLVLTAVALLLSLAGIYAVLSFTVARRTREIGVRVALGASRRRVITEIFRRPLTQVAIGVAVGGVLVGAAAFIMSGHVPDQPIDFSKPGPSPAQVALLVAYAALMFVVCLLACIVPTRRALRIQPSEALRAE
ncbi:MAG: ABC transporter permease [Gemmatimonadetes bacterium]|nr:ABC transporter permease [Gemmatimonadota bacterium]